MEKNAATGENSSTTSTNSGGNETVSSPIISDSLSIGTNLQLVIQKLNGKNYVEWAQSVKLALDGKGKLGYLTGDTSQPGVTDPSLPRWKSENSLIIAWLINLMDSSIGKSYLFLPTAKDVLEAVRDCYSDLENSSQIYELKTQLWQSKQGDKDVTTFYNLMVTLWQELDQYYEDDWENPNDATRFKKREENDRVYMFLAGLNQELNEVRGRILGRKSLPSMREVFFEVRREESRRKSCCETLMVQGCKKLKVQPWLQGDTNQKEKKEATLV
ncbi:uncharacterized protein [Glycine max]|uniref:uncharacterized protein n=1 Tax=Glycine max TaxID=3847 RepID=UPI0003DEBD3F|nr:uncharacterized protein LOC102665526 [Glycine max]|eukprot:XP_006589216.1 uncharacterized protein LOC102665526 [Glycine max]